MLLSVCRLAWADLRFDWRISFCMVAAMVAVVAPLLLLFGLKHGVVTQLQQALLHDPRNLEVKMLSSGSFDQAWLDRLRQMSGVAYAVGMTRSLNTQADLRLDRRRFLENVEVLASAQGDPLLQTQARDLSPQEIILTQEAARRLNWQAGELVHIRVDRRLDGQREQGDKAMTVVDVLAEHRYSRPAVFVAPETLLALEYARDGFQVPDFALFSGNPLAADMPVLYARARVYASTIDQVGAVAKGLEQQGIPVASRYADIENVRAINRVLSLIFGVIALTAMVGCAASLGGAFLANVDRKRKDLAVLRLLGIDSGGVIRYVLIQALVLSLIAYALGLGLYGLGSALFNQLLVGDGLQTDFVCRITPAHALYALLMVASLACVVAAIGAWRAVRVQPAESLREM